jgi:hypothetical protein
LFHEMFTPQRQSLSTAVCPESVASKRPVPASHTRAVPSSYPVTMREPSGLNPAVLVLGMGSFVPDVYSIENLPSGVPVLLSHNRAVVPDAAQREFRPN